MIENLINCEIVKSINSNNLSSQTKEKQKLDKNFENDIKGAQKRLNFDVCD